MTDAEPSEQLPQLTLRDTALDACSRKRHAVSKGYFADPYLKYFAPDSTIINSPLMNRGYWLRVRAVESALNRFVETLPPGAPFQVVSLGAGYDTLFFRCVALGTGTDPEHAASAHDLTDLAASQREEDVYALSATSPAGVAIREGRLKRFVEIDQHEVLVGKRAVVRAHKDLVSIASISTDAPPTGPIPLDSVPVSPPDVYRMLAADLTHASLLHEALLASAPSTEKSIKGRNLPHEVPLFDEPVQRPLLDGSVATIILAECVLVYLAVEESTQLLNELVNNTLSQCPQVALLSYDAVNPTTPFGKQMVSTLNARGIALKGIHHLPTPQHHADRCQQLGFASVQSWTMKALFANVPISIQRRLQHIEQLDDYDEWCLVHDHYSMTWALKTAVPTTSRDGKPPKLFDNSGDIAVAPSTHHKA